SSADVDIGPSLQLSGLNAPFNQVGLTGGFSVDAAVNLSNSFNFAVGVLDQTFYTISLGGQGPAATVQDDIGANVLAVTDVQYGRIAYIIVASASSSATASAVANQLVTLSNPFVSVSGDRQLSAAARAALAGGFVRVKILGGSSSTAVTVTDLATLRNYIQQIRPTVGGSNAVPIRYTLRYARDNATAFVQALGNFNDRECARASQLKVKLKSITATKVEEVGGEELYGTVRVKTGPGITAVDGNTLWDVDADNAVDGSKDRPIQINRERTFNINPLDGELADVTLSLNLRDRIAAEEHPFTTKFGQDNGFVRYGPDQVTVKLQDIRDAPDAKLSKNFTLTEDGADSTLRLSFDFELVPVY
ncbi:MAG: thiol-activated cytolysin family protein, partial [Steroidobacteraceae bacterium]|nr:thiol-activated cytolysin family protein [Steroidobacteraceae bacterium]